MWRVITSDANVYYAPASALLQLGVVLERRETLRGHHAAQMPLRPAGHFTLASPLRTPCPSLARMHQAAPYATAASLCHRGGLGAMVISWLLSRFGTRNANNSACSRRSRRRR